MASEAQQRREYEVRLAKLGLSSGQRERLHRLANRLQRFEEAVCSFEWWNLRGAWVRPDECGEGEKIKAALGRWLDEINLDRPDDQKVEMELNGDPRGAVVKLRGGGLPCTSFGGEGWFCVWADGYNEEQMDRLTRASEYHSDFILRPFDSTLGARWLKHQKARSYVMRLRGQIKGWCVVCGMSLEQAIETLRAAHIGRGFNEEYVNGLPVDVHGEVYINHVQAHDKRVELSQ